MGCSVCPFAGVPGISLVDLAVNLFPQRASGDGGVPPAALWGATVNGLKHLEASGQDEGRLSLCDIMGMMGAHEKRYLCLGSGFPVWQQRSPLPTLALGWAALVHVSSRYSFPFIWALFTCKANSGQLGALARHLVLPWPLSWPLLASRSRSGRGPASLCMPGRRGWGSSWAGSQETQGGGLHLPLRFCVCKTGTLISRPCCLW